MKKVRNKITGEKSPLNQPLISLEGELWADVVNYEGLYKVSNMGRVYSIGRYIPHKRLNRMWINSKYLELTKRHDKNKPGVTYNYVSLCKDGVITKYLVHRLVAIAFVPNPNNYPFIDHIDGNPNNNFYQNLRWCDQYINMNNPISIQRSKKSARFKGKLNDPLLKPKKIVKIQDGNIIIFPSVSEVVRVEQCNKTYLLKCIKSHRLFKKAYWLYLSDYETLINKSKNESNPDTD